MRSVPRDTADTEPASRGGTLEGVPGALCPTPVQVQLFPPCLPPRPHTSTFLAPASSTAGRGKHMVLCTAHGPKAQEEASDYIQLIHLPPWPPLVSAAALAVSLSAPLPAATQIASSKESCSFLKSPNLCTLHCLGLSNQDLFWATCAKSNSGGGPGH